MLTLFFTFLMSGVAQAQVPLPPHEGQYEIKAEFDYFTSSNNYNSGGGVESLEVFGSPLYPTGGRFSLYDGLGQFTYDINSMIRAYAGISGGETGVDVYDPTRSNLATFPPIIFTNYNTTEGFTQAWLGGQFWWRAGDFDIVPQADLRLPFFGTDPNYNSPLLGEGVTEFQTGGWVRYQHWNELTLFGYLGFDYRQGGRSGLMPWDVGARYALNQFYFEGDLRGFESVTNDPDSNNRPVRDAYLTRTDGGSYEFDSVNPERGEIAGLVGVNVGAFEIYGGLMDTIWGHSSADGWGASVGVKFTGSFYKPFAERREKEKDKFEAQPEKYDDSVFKQTAPVTTPDDQNTEPSTDEDQEQQPAPKPKVHQQKKKPESTMPNVEQLMKDTEKTLEKKGN